MRISRVTPARVLAGVLSKEKRGNAAVNGKANSLKEIIVFLTKSPNILKSLWKLL